MAFHSRQLLTRPRGVALASESKPDARTHMIEPDERGAKVVVSQHPRWLVVIMRGGWRDFALDCGTVLRQPAGLIQAARAISEPAESEKGTSHSPPIPESGKL